MAPQAVSNSTATSTYSVVAQLKGGLLLLVSLLILLALLGIGNGWINELIANALRGLVGWGAYPITILLGFLGLQLLLPYRWHRQVKPGRILSVELLTLCFLTLATLINNPQLEWALAASGVGGGVVGLIIATLVSPVGTSGGMVLLGLLIVMLLPSLFGFSLSQVADSLKHQQATLLGWRRDLLSLPATNKPINVNIKKKTSSQKPTAATPPTKQAQQRQQASPVAQPANQQTDQSASTVLGMVKEVAGKAAAKAEAATLKAKQKLKGEAPATAEPEPIPKNIELPSLDLLQQHESHIDPSVAHEKARQIEETLRHFGVPATVVQINQGPTVTQFGLQPGFIETTRRDGSTKQRKIKVSAITSLADDLALALAAKSIRVEAPVPGRPYVGIELPNDNTELVTLHSVLTSEAFKKMKSHLAVALGRDVSGNAVAADLSRMPHALIAGATGSGKSVCVNTIIASLLFNFRPEQLQLLMIDPKMVELMPYNGIPHLVAPVVTDMERVVGALTWALREMERRYKLFSQVGKRNHESYNKWAVQQGKEELPYIVIIIDELADLMMVAPDEVEQIICRIAQMARATGMHLILATQRPSVDVVTGLIKANVPTRISFAVASSTDSRVILDQTGSENLLGRGDMLYQASDSGKLQRLQGCFVSDQELHALVSHWMRYSPSRQPTQSTESPWDDIVEELAQEEEPQDELLPQAIEIVREHQWASTSFLQRKLRIGYTRAARLIDVLEEKGFIGPPKEGGNGSREVLVEPLE